MYEEKTIVYSYNKDTKIYTISDKEMQKINRKLKERFILKQENKQLKEVIEEVREYIKNNATDENGDIGINFYAWQTYELLQILDKARENK